MDEDKIVAQTKAWLEHAVIGLNLCPFAKAVYLKNRIRFVVSSAVTPESLHRELVAELEYLHRADPAETDTTLLIHPWVLTDFSEYNDFLAIADQTIEELDLAGEIQVASFHPDYQFEGSHPDDIENYTNRSPYPILHLLREASIDAAVKAFPDAAEIYEKNLITMQQIGQAGWQQINTMIMNGVLSHIDRNNK